MDQDIILFQTQKLQQQPEFQQKQFQCNLCNEITDELFTNQCVEISIQVCLICHNLINTNKQNLLLGICWRMQITDVPYCSKVRFFLDSQAKFYNLKYQECKICCIQTICCKVCMNEHYFCINCTDKYIEQRYSKKHQIHCPEQLCNLELNHYLIAQFISLEQVKYWKIINRDLFCIKKSCRSLFLLSPYQNIQPQHLKKIDENIVECLSCRIKICTTCHSQVKGSLNKHKQYCNQLAINQFEIYCQINAVIKCPKCRILTLPKKCRLRFSNQGSIKEPQIQQCQLCNTTFCIICQSIEVNLFPQLNQQILNQIYFNKPYLSHCYTCNLRQFSTKNKCKKVTQKLISKCFYIPKILRGLCKILLIIIWLPFYQFMQVGKIVGDFIDNQVNKIEKGKAPYIFCCCGPLIALFIICSIFILYAIFFIPLFIRNFYRKINDQQL